MDGKEESIVQIAQEEIKDAGEDAKEVTAASLRFPKIKIGEREIPLAYTLRAQIAIDEELEMTWDELRENINQLKGNRNTKKMITAIRILGNAGLQRAGKEPDLTDEWLLDHIRPKDMLAYKVAMLQTLFAGQFMETDRSDEGEVDLGLIEIRKKNASTE